MRFVGIKTRPVSRVLETKHICMPGNSYPYCPYSINIHLNMGKVKKANFLQDRQLELRNFSINLATNLAVAKGEFL